MQETTKQANELTGSLLSAISKQGLAFMLMAFGLYYQNGRTTKMEADSRQNLETVKTEYRGELERQRGELEKVRVDLKDCQEDKEERFYLLLEKIAAGQALRRK
jgi:hypothetical protein